jgi:hypothetical protein
MIKLRALVAKGHKNTNAPLIFENLGYYFFWFWANYIMGHFSGYFEEASTFLPTKKIISRIFKISGALIVNKTNPTFLLINLA